MGYASLTHSYGSLMKNGIKKMMQAMRNNTLPSSPKISPLRRLEAMKAKAERMNTTQPAM